jgi:hypothetical protein
VVLEKEDNTSLTVKSGNEPEVIAKDQVVKRIDAASSMPDMKTILSKKK